LLDRSAGMFGVFGLKAAFRDLVIFIMLIFGNVLE